MKENRDAIYVTVTITILSIIGAAIVTYNESVNSLFLKAGFVVNILLGIFSGAVLSLFIAIINYTTAKRQELTGYVNFINCLNIEIIPVFNLFKEGKRSIEHEINIILSIYDILVENLHMKPFKIHFFIPNNRTEKKINEILELTSNLYVKVLKTKLSIDKYKFECIDINEMDSIISELFMFFRDYKEGELFTNALTKLHEDLLLLTHLNYARSEEMKF